MTNRRPSTPLALLLLVLAGMGLVTTSTTLAAFSDRASLPDNRLAAAAVVLGHPGGEDAGPHLSFRNLAPGETTSQSMMISYRGTIPADLALVLTPSNASSFCARQANGSWKPRDGGAVEVSVGGSAWVGYCSLLVPGASLSVRDSTPPGERVVLELQARLTTTSDMRYDGLTEVTQLAVIAHQSGGTGSFSDASTGTLSMATRPIDPVAADPNTGASGRSFDSADDDGAAKVDPRPTSPSTPCDGDERGPSDAHHASPPDSCKHVEPPPAPTLAPAPVTASHPAEPPPAPTPVTPSHPAEPSPTAEPTVAP